MTKTNPHATTLARPLTLTNGTMLPNRIAKSALSETMAHARTGSPTEKLIQLYRRWARSGAGLLITGNVIVAQNGRAEPNNVVVEDERNLPMLRRWAEAAQAHGARLWMQLNHAGRQSPKRVNRKPVAPSPVELDGLTALFRRPRTLDHDEILEIVNRFANAARIAKKAGFSGVQIHAAHGYLVSQFLSPLANRRTDQWGGTAENRRRFLLEIIRATRAAVGPDFPIGVKLNSADFQRGGFDEEESMNVARALEAEGVDLLEISGGNYESPAMMGDYAEKISTREREAYFLDYAQKIRTVVEIPLLLTGGMRTAATMGSVIEDGAVDMIGLGRPMIVEPDLPARILDGEAQAARSVQVRIGIKLLDGMLQTVWYQAQFRRIASGRDPKPGLSPLVALASGFVRNFAFNPLPWPRRRQPKMLECANAIDSTV